MPESPAAENRSILPDLAARIAEIDRQIELHAERHRQQSWLGAVVDSVWRADEHSLSDLRSARDKAINGGLSADEVSALVEKDKRAQELQGEISHYGSGFLKTAALFLRGKAGLAGTIGLYALDQMRPSGSIGEQAADLAMGGAKGGLLKGAFHVLGQKQVGIAARGVGLGMSARVLDLALTRQTYAADTAGGYDLGLGASRVVRGALDKAAVATDLVVFGAAHGMLAGANRLTEGAIRRSPLASTMLTGTTFGLSAGATGEIMRQRQAGEDIDLSKVAGRALLQGAIDTFAAAPGGIQGDAAFRAGLARRAAGGRDTFDARLAGLRRSLDSIDAYVKEWQADRLRYKVAVDVVANLQKAGHTAVFAGGSVRDQLMGKRPKDYDIATSATPEQVERLFPRTIPTGKDYGVMTVLSRGVLTEVATLRTDGQYSDGRRPDTVSYLTAPGEQSLRMDAARRDFTINAMFKDPISGRVYDFFGGRQDIKQSVIRAVGNPHERILEDRLRMMRAARFASRYGFTVDPALEAAITTHASKINGVQVAKPGEGAAGFGERSALDKPVSGERIRDELGKILTSPRPLVGLDLLMRTGLMRQILPELAETNTRRGDQDPVWHPEGNTWVHTRLVVEQLSKQNAPLELMFGGLFHDIGKPRTQVRHGDGGISNHGHAEVGAEMFKDISRRLKFSNEQADRIGTLVLMHMKMHKGPEMRPARLAELLENRYIRDMIALQNADATGTARPDRITKSLLPFYRRKLQELSQKAEEAQKLGASPLVTGETLIKLGHKPGPAFKQMLEEARDAQREGVFRTAEEANIWARDRFGRSGSR